MGGTLTLSHILCAPQALLELKQGKRSLKNNLLIDVSKSEVKQLSAFNSFIENNCALRASYMSAIVLAVLPGPEVSESVPRPKKWMISLSDSSRIPQPSTAQGAL